MIDNPIFIVGTGRCGSTIFHDVLSNHRALGWLSQLANKRPSKPHRNRWGNALLHYPMLGSIAARLVKPSEPYAFWEHYCHGFSRPYRDITRADVIPRSALKIKNAFDKAIPQSKRPLAKITGWPRMSYLKEIFPDAKFVHIIRDGRAVVNSVLAAPYFDGWAGPSQWARGELTERQLEAWKSSGESFVVLAAIGWENRMDAFEIAKRDIPSNDYLEIKYEDFCDATMETLDRALEFLNLTTSRYTVPFRQVVRKFKLRNQNQKWRSDLSSQQQQLLEEYLAPIVARYDYPTSGFH